MELCALFNEAAELKGLVPLQQRLHVTDAAFNLVPCFSHSPPMEAGDEGIERVVKAKDWQNQSKALDKLTDRVEHRQLDSTCVQEGCILDCAEMMDVVAKKGSWYSYGEYRLGQGRDRALQFLTENPTLCDEIEKLQYKQMTLDDAFNYVKAIRFKVLLASSQW